MGMQEFVPCFPSPHVPTLVIDGFFLESSWGCKFHWSSYILGQWQELSDHLSWQSSRIPYGQSSYVLPHAYTEILIFQEMVGHWSTAFSLMASVNTSSRKPAGTWFCFCFVMFSSAVPSLKGSSQNTNSLVPCTSRHYSLQMNTVIQYVSGHPIFISHPVCGSVLQSHTLKN